MLSKDLLKRESTEDADESFYMGEDPDASFYDGDDLDKSLYNGDDPGTSFYDRDNNDDYPDGGDDGPPRKKYEEIIGDENDKKIINQYIHLGKIGSGSYGKVVL